MSIARNLVKSALFVTFASPVLAQSVDRGWCPPLPAPDSSRISKAGPMPPAPPVPGATYLGTTGLLATVSERGYVCEASVVRSVSKDLDQQAIRTAMNWRFRPARFGRERVSTVVVMNVPIWRRPDGALLTSEGITVESPPGTVARKP